MHGNKTGLQSFFLYLRAPKIDYKKKRSEFLWLIHLIQ